MNDATVARASRAAAVVWSQLWTWLRAPGPPAVVRALPYAIWAAVLARWLPLALASLRFDLDATFAADDWNNLVVAAYPKVMLAQIRGEVFRPFTPLLFGALHYFAHLGPRGFAWFFVGVHVATVWVLARLLRSLGFTREAQVLTAMLVLVSPFTTELFGFFFTQQQLAVARLATLCGLDALMARGRWSTARALASTMLAFCTHEQGVLVVPLLGACIVFRDGLSGLGPALRRTDVRAVLALFVVYVTLHALYLFPSQDHALSLAALPSKLTVLRSFVRTEWMLGARHKLNRAVIAALTVAYAVLAGHARSLVLAARRITFCAVWVVVGYAIFALAVNTTADYFFNVSQLGMALAVATVIAPAMFSRALPIWVRVLWVVLALGTTRLGWRGSWQTVRDRSDDSTRVLAEIARSLTEHPARFARLVFVEDLADEPDPYHLVPRYVGAMGGAYDWNERWHGDRWLPNGALAVTFPRTAFRVSVVTAATARAMCVRPGDTVLHAIPVEHGWYRFERVAPGCGADRGAATDALGRQVDAFWRAWIAFDDTSASARWREIEGTWRAMSEPERRAAFHRYEAVRAMRPP